MLDGLNAGGAADVGEALRMIEAGLDHGNGPDGVAVLEAAACGGVLTALGGFSAKFAAARSAALAKFDAARGHDGDGYGSSASWLAATNRETRKAMGAQVRQMHVLRRHPLIADALARGDISESWAAEMAEWTRKLPPDWRASVDKLLVDTASAGANLEDLAVVARAAYEKWRSQQPDPDDPDDGFDDRYLKLGTTIDNAGRLNGNLTPECTAALQAVLEALGKKHGPEDDRTDPQRYHDALQLACELLIRAKMVPGRAGADTRVDAVISLAELMLMEGASALQGAWLAGLARDPGGLAARAGQPGYLAGKDAEAAACDAIISPVVTGHPDLAVVDQMIGIVLAHLDAAQPGAAGPGAAPSPEAWRAASTRGPTPRAQAPATGSNDDGRGRQHALRRLRRRGSCRPGRLGLRRRTAGRSPGYRPDKTMVRVWVRASMA